MRRAGRRDCRSDMTSWRAPALSHDINNVVAAPEMRDIQIFLNRSVTTYECRYRQGYSDVISTFLSMPALLAAML